MSNVLPETSEVRVWHLYRARFIIAGSILALLVALLAFLLLLPSYLALQANEATLPRATTSVTLPKEQADIARTQSILSTLQPLMAATTSPSEALASALALRPHGVVVDGITYNPGLLLITGVSARDAINTYKKALLGDSHFKSVFVPVEDLAGAGGGRFSVTLSGNF